MAYINEWLTWRVCLGNLMVRHLMPNGSYRWVPAGIDSARQLLSMSWIYDERERGTGAPYLVWRSAADITKRHGVIGRDILAGLEVVDRDSCRFSFSNDPYLDLDSSCGE